MKGDHAAFPRSFRARPPERRCVTLRPRARPLYISSTISRLDRCKKMTQPAGASLSFVFPNSQSIPIGVVVRKSPGVTRWAKWAWRVIGILPGAGPANWTVLRQDGQVTEFHAATFPLQLFVSDTEAYAHELQTRQPSIYIVLSPHAASPDTPWKVTLVTASPYEAQDYCDSAEVMVEKVARRYAGVGRGLCDTPP